MGNIESVFYFDSLYCHNAMRRDPQHHPGNHPYPTEIRINQIRKKSQNRDAENNPQRHWHNADKNIKTKPFPFFLPYIKTQSKQ